MNEKESAPVVGRRLRTRNNFLAFTTYLDRECTQVDWRIGQLVNYCVNEQSESTGNQRSYLTKINKKENFLIELEFEGLNCQVRREEKILSFRWLTLTLLFFLFFFFRVFQQKSLILQVQCLVILN